MGTGTSIETRGHIVGFQEEIARAAEASAARFFTWFNAADSVETAYVRGMWDFICHIAGPAAPFLREPERLTALEIGHGAGRILFAACRAFKAAIGVDIHDRNSLVEQQLRALGASNFELFRGDGRGLPVSDNSTDFVYSFIVLQHVERIDIFQRYVQETARVLRPGGLALLYFGRRSYLSLNRGGAARYWGDRILESVLLPSGYRETPARVNCTNLHITVGHAKRLARRAGFAILRTLVSRKRVPDGLHLYGGQHGLLLRKPSQSKLKP